MLSALHFETIAPASGQAPNRTDVACFIGHVARRDAVALPEAVRAQLRLGGWLDGPWALSGHRIEALWQVPVAVDSWEAFDRLFAWERRTLRSGASSLCASYLGAAVRSYFANGGRRAVIVRTGRPWPYLGGFDRAAQRRLRLFRLLPATATGMRPFELYDPRVWRGLEHLYGLPDVSHVCLPDLADACASEPEPLRIDRPPPTYPDVFVECSPDEPALPDDLGLRFVQAPRLHPDEFKAWTRAVDLTRGFLARHRRDVLFIGALPLPHVDAREDDRQAQSDWLGFLQRNGVFESQANAEGVGLPADLEGGHAASAFVQLTWPWLRTTRSSDLPEQLEAADGSFAGTLAANALARGTFRSVAGTRLPEAVLPTPMPELGLGPDSPSARLAQRVCLIGPEPEGIVILSDVTSSVRRGWRQGGASRLMAALLRAARRIGEQETFELNGPALWARIRRDLETLLDSYRSAGGLGGASSEEAYQVRCDRSTMTQNDLDNGRVRVEITILPASAIERITFALDLSAGGASVQRLSEVA